MNHAQSPSDTSNPHNGRPPAPRFLKLNQGDPSSSADKQVSNTQSLRDVSKPPPIPPLPRQPLMGNRSSAPSPTTAAQRHKRILSAEPTQQSRVRPMKPMPHGPAPPIPPPPDDYAIAAARLGLRSKDAGHRPLPTKREVLMRGPPAHRSVNRKRSTTVPSVLLTPQGPLPQVVQGIADTQSRLVKKRLDVVAHRKDLKGQLSLYLEAHSDFVSLVEEIFPEIETSNLSWNAKARLSKARTKSVNLSTIIKSWQSALDVQEEDLLRLEAQSITQGNDLIDYLHDFMPHLSSDRRDNQSETLSETFLPTVSEVPSMGSVSSATPRPAREKYLNAIGQINLLRDHIFNLESDFRREKRERQMARENHEKLETSDDDFYDEFNKRRLKIIESYRNFKVEMSTAYDECLENGYEVQEPNLPPYIDELFKEDDELYTVRNPHDQVFETSQAARNIERWAQHVQHMSIASSHVLPGQELLDPEIEDGRPTPIYQETRASTDLERTVRTSRSRSGARTPAFPGEVPKARRRWSAPMLLERTGRFGDTPALDYEDMKARKNKWKQRDRKLGLRHVKSECRLHNLMSGRLSDGVVAYQI